MLGSSFKSRRYLEYYRGTLIYNGWYSDLIGERRIIEALLLVSVKEFQTKLERFCHDKKSVSETIHPLNSHGYYKQIFNYV